MENKPLLSKRLIFRWRERLFAIPVNSVREIMKSQRIVPLPVPDDRILGLVNTGTTIIPVLRLDDETRTPDVLIVLDIAGQPAAIPADTVVKVDEISGQPIPDFPAATGGQISSRWPGLICGLATVDSSTVMFLNPDAIQPDIR